MMYIIIMIWTWLMERTWRHWRSRHTRKGRGISLIVPFRADSVEREETWLWLEKFYSKRLPKAEIIVGTDLFDGPFSKTVAMNDAARFATGDIFVILDADALIDPKQIIEAAKRIREAREQDKALYYVPYRRFYRLTHEASSKKLTENPARCSFPPDDRNSPDVEAMGPYGHSTGHWYGALVQVLPREAWELIGGFDERFRSWGGEDISILRCLDTVFGKHKTLDAPVWAMWHPTHGVGTSRTWAGGTAFQNSNLASRYNAAYGDRARMLDLCHEWQDAS